MTELQIKTDDELFQIMKAQMNTEEEQIFMTSHYLYLQHGSDSTKFVIDFDTVWKNVEFTRKDSAKKVLEKHFKEHIDYKIIASAVTEAAPPNCGAAMPIGGAGKNKETILLTVDYCMSTPNKGLKDLLSKHFKLCIIDEFRTSKTCSYCIEGETCYAKQRENPRPFREGLVNVHGLLTCKKCSESSHSHLINRDLNGSRNILTLMKEWIYHRNRPTAFCRKPLLIS